MDALDKFVLLHLYLYHPLILFVDSILNDFDKKIDSS